jgi:hypothetical protein
VTISRAEEPAMTEFMLYVRNDGSALPPQTEATFVRACERYIEELQRAGKLIAAQPLAHEGKIVSRAGAGWHELSVGGTGELNAGYYHLRADSLEEAIAIAKRNPEFAFRPSARIEVRAIKTAETTGYEYPSGAQPV